MEETTTHEAETYRKEAAAIRDRVQESFDRCDTDGFVSQWAGGLSAQLAETRARLVEAGRVSTFTGLYEGDRRVPAKRLETRFGYSWLLRDDADIAHFGRKWIPCGGNSRIQKTLGLRECLETAPAWANLSGRGHGLGGTCWVAVYRTGCEWGTDATKDEE